MSQRRIAACVAFALALAAACSDSGTGPDVGPTLEGNFSLQTIDGAPLPIAQRKIVGPDSTTRSCTDYLASMQIVVSSGSATRSESHNLLCTDGTDGITTSTFESGKAFPTADGWRLDFTGVDLALSTHYYGRLDGATLTIVRRETVLMSAGQVIFTGAVDLSQLVFKRL